MPTKKTKKIVMSITVDPMLYLSLKSYSEKHNVPMSQVIEQAVKEFLEKGK